MTASSNADPPRELPAGILLTVSYDGAGFLGFAPQKEGRTVHGVLTAALRVVDPLASALRGASRTDSGVHARGQLVAFDPERAIPAKGWVLGLNTHLPSDLAVRMARVVPRGFEPRACGEGKRYRYSLLIDPVRDPLLERWTWRIDGPFDLPAARAEAMSLIGTHDFRAFRSTSDERRDTRRTLTRVELCTPYRSDPRVIAIEVEGSAFLHNMVRIIAGTLVDVGRRRLAPGAVTRALVTGLRTDLGVTAPACGLELDHVDVTLPPEVPAWP